MSRSGLFAVVVLCGCQGQPVLEVSLGDKAFEVKDAVFFSLQHSLAPPTTLVVFGDQPGLCQRFDDARNVCNARMAPDVHDGLINTLSRPAGATRPLGWLVMRSATEGPALVAPDDLRLGTPGASLTEGAQPALHSTKNRVVIDQLVVGDVGTFSFQSELSDGRAFRGRVEATWCPALDMVNRYSKLTQPAGNNSGPLPSPQLGRSERAECEGDLIDSQCLDSGRGVTCSCTQAGVTSTCEGRRDPDKGIVSCCSFRFGD